MHMRILLTGADGLLGSNLVRLLLKGGHTVRVFLYPSTTSRTLDGLEVERFTGDILKPETLDEAVQGSDAVIHAAAMTNIWPARSEQIRKVNIQGTQHVIDAVLKHGISRMIYIGSGSSVNTKGTEGNTHSFPGAKFRLDYIDSKFAALHLVLDAVKSKGLPALAILPTFMLGPYDSLPSSGQMILAVARGKMKFYTSGGRNFIYVNDVATAILNSLTTGTIGKYYIACNENLSYKDFLGRTAAIVNKPKPRICIPDWLVKSVGYAGTIMGKTLNREPMISYPMARISCEEQYVICEDAVTELHMPRTNIDTAIRECYDWFIENNYIKK
jgi:dihydroflavonol-4-reductase